MTSRCRNQKKPEKRNAALPWKSKLRQPGLRYCRFGLWAGSGLRGEQRRPAMSSACGYPTIRSSRRHSSCGLKPRWPRPASVSTGWFQRCRAAPAALTFLKNPTGTTTTPVTPSQRALAVSPTPGPGCWRPILPYWRRRARNHRSTPGIRQTPRQPTECLTWACRPRSGLCAMAATPRPALPRWTSTTCWGDGRSL